MKYSTSIQIVSACYAKSPLLSYLIYTFINVSLKAGS